MRTLNDVFCAEPFPFTGTQTEKRASGLRQISNYTGLVRLRVLADGPEGIQKGDVVLVSAKDVKLPYGIARHKLSDDVECIFVPKHQVLLVERQERVLPAQPRPTPLPMPPGAGDLR